MRKLNLFLIILSIFISGCSSRGDGSFSREYFGTVTGGIAGGFVGNEFGKGTGKAINTYTGSFVGSLVGNQWGREVDKQQLKQRYGYSRNAAKYMPYNSYEAWKNPNTKQVEIRKTIETVAPAEYKPIPCQAFETSNGRANYQGQLCLDRYGRWRVID